MKKTNNQNNLLHKSFSTKDFEIKSNEKGFGTITGIANKVNVIDSYGDMTVKGAFDKSIKNNPTVLALKDHWFSKVMGSSHLTLAQDGSLIVEMELNKDVQDGKETYVLAKQLLAAGRPLELSIGYIVNKSSEQEIDGQKVKVLEELDIKEVSVVP
jgi:HK97 family phage prohead protease